MELLELCSEQREQLKPQYHQYKLSHVVEGAERGPVCLGCDKQSRDTNWVGKAAEPSPWKASPWCWKVWNLADVVVKFTDLVDTPVVFTLCLVK